MANGDPKTKPKVLSLRLGAQASLDFVWEGDICLVVFAKRGVFQERIIARLLPGQPMEASRFLAKIEPLPAPVAVTTEDDDEITKP